MASRPALGYAILTLAVLAFALGAVALLAVPQTRSHARLGDLSLARRTCEGTPVPATASFDSSGASESAYRFVYDAVFRKDPERAWVLSTPNERGGWGEKQWATGDIPVPPEPVSVACTVGAAHPKGDEWDAVIRVNSTYYLTTVLHRAGLWLVDYWGPVPHDFAPQGNG